MASKNLKWMEYCSKKLALMGKILFILRAFWNEVNAAHLFCLRKVLHFILQAHNFHK